MSLHSLPASGAEHFSAGAQQGRAEDWPAGASGCDRREVSA